MEKRLILRGALVGALGGLVTFGFARIFAEPQIGKAIDYENGRNAAQALLDKAAGLRPEAAEPELFSRTIQADVGLGAGMILFGVAMGLLFAVGYAVCLGRVGNLRPRSLSLVLAAAGLLGMYLLPFLKYPANPPSIGHADTIKQRAGLHLVMVIGSVVTLALAGWIGQRLKPRVGTWYAALLAGATGLVVIGVLMAVLPSFGHLAANREVYGDHGTETPLPLRDPAGRIVYPGFPADVLFTFRLYSVGAQLLLWTTIGLCFAPLAERLLDPEQASPARQVHPASA
jgi:hypothetical protein